MSNRILDVSSLEKLSTLIGIAKENSLAVSIDYLSDLWIAQMFDLQERVVVSTSGKSMNEVVQRLHQCWFAKTAPKT